MCGEMHCDCGNELNLCKLCVKNGCAHRLGVNCLTAKNACVSETLNAVSINVQQETANNLCVAQNLSAAQANIVSLNSNDLCSQRGTINALCVNELTVKTLNHCEEYRAAATFGANTPYTLGAPINWDVILNDPNNNIALGPFSYTVPVSGYYIVTLHMDIKDLTGPNIITGVPVSVMNLLVNNSPLRSQTTAFLTFNTGQNSSLTSLCLLNAGDVITMNESVMVFDISTGIQPYAGTVTIEANGSFPGESGFAIHYLSSLNCSPVICQTCPPVQLPCTPQTISCLDNPCDTMCCSFNTSLAK